MPYIRYGKTGLFGQTTPGLYTPSYTPPQPSPTLYTPPYSPPRPSPMLYTPPYSPPRPSPLLYTPPYSPPRPSPTLYTPHISPGYPTTPYQGTPSYAPPPEGIPIQINPEEAGLYPEGSIPGEYIPLYSAGGGAFGPASETVEETLPEEEPKKTNWLWLLLLAVGAYILLEGEL